MTRSNRLTVLAAMLAGLALAAADAQAQYGGGMRHGGSGDRGGRPAESRQSQPVRPSLTERLDQLAAQLLLTPQQGRSWDAFRTAFLALQGPMGIGTVSVAAMSEPGIALRAMQQKLSQAQDHFTLVEVLSDRLKDLDREFDPQQRATADRLLPPLLAEFVRTGGEAPRSQRD